jgi:flagellar biosynthesis protein FlhG
MMKDESARPKVIAITSGKGGVGKTNIASNLSICMAANNKKVLLFDADLGLGNVDVVINAESTYNLTHVLSGYKTLQEVTTIAPGGVEVICGGSGVEELANINSFQLQRLLEEFQELQDSSDVIILDTGAGIHNSTISFCQAADHVLVVATPEPASMTDAYAMIKVLASRDYKGRISLVVNMVSSMAEGKQIYRQISQVASRFLNIDLYEAGIICKTDKLISSVRKRQPVVLSYPKSKITANFVSMASRLIKTPVVSKDSQGFFKKVVNLFSRSS